MGFINSRIKIEGWDYLVEIVPFFQSFEKYRTDVNVLIEKEMQVSTNNYEEYRHKEKEMSGNIHYELEHWEHLVKITVGANLREIYYDSMISLLYSFLERQLFFLCRHLENHQQILLEDISGKGIFKYCKYLEKVIGIDSKEIENHLANIQHFNRIRNHIIHSDGNRMVSKDNKQLIHAIESVPGISLNESDGKWLKFRFENDSSIVLLEVTCAAILDFYFHERS